MAVTTSPTTPPTTNTTTPAATTSPYPTNPGQAGRESLVTARRAIIKMFRVPEQLFFNLVQPLLFILLFAYVFGGAIGSGAGGRDQYREFMMAGFFGQCIIFVTVISASTNIAQDMTKGMVDRFRSLPMSRGAVLTGRTIADFVQNLLMLAVMITIGLLVGWRIHEGFLKALGGFALLLFLAYGFSWVGATIGMTVRTPEAASGVIIILFPITMLSNAFVPPNTLPRALQHVVNWNPFSSTVQAAREAFGNPYIPSESFPMQHATWASLGWSVLLIAVFRTLAVRKYKKAAK